MQTRLRFLLFPLLLLVVTLSVAPPLVSPAAAAACHGFITCPDPKSCASWTAFTACEDPFCDSHPSCDIKSNGIATVQLKERFRACTLSNGSQCIEWQTSSFVVHCGC
ncbi:MAG TPA: hypothetical protein VGS07_27360 [Thermoanaerobaculia bacterium]|jgi:hypothetical protein|nr:hypothetical protein [Thermoanaerobaculia bacterium]